MIIISTHKERGFRRTYNTSIFTKDTCAPQHTYLQNMASEEAAAIATA